MKVKPKRKPISYRPASPFNFAANANTCLRNSSKFP